MRIRMLGLCLVGLLLLSHVKAIAAPLDEAAMDRYLREHLGSKSRVAISAAIVENGKVAFAKAYGFADKESKKTADPETMFAIGSVSKQFTCAGILLLAEEHKLSVGDKLSKYYPRLPHAAEITLLQLMTHTSGYPDYYPLDFVDARMKKPIQPDDLIARQAAEKLDFPPGTEWSYSNTGYIILGRIIEKKSGLPLGAFLAKRIFEPLGMRRTLMEPAASTANLALGYTTFNLGGPERVAPEALGWLGGAGGICSTPSDLARWDIALMEGKLLKPASMRVFTNSYILQDGRDTQYACGWRTSLRHGRTALQHSGSVSGFQASNILFPGLKTAVILLCNVDYGMSPMPEGVLGILFPDKKHLPEISGPPAEKVALELLAHSQKAQVVKDLLGPDFIEYLQAQDLQAAARRLAPYGVPESARIMDRSERGGMEVTVTRFSFKEGRALEALMYRTPDGKVQQFFIGENWR